MEVGARRRVVAGLVVTTWLVRAAAAQTAGPPAEAATAGLARHLRHTVLTVYGENMDTAP